jgi:conjugal transfer pilus assembly protein TraD
MRNYEDMFRPSHETIAVCGWGFGTVMLLVLRPPFWYVGFLVALTMLLLRAVQLRKLWAFRMSLAVTRARTIPILDLIKKSRLMRTKRKSLYLGRGFVWGQKHAEIADQIANRNIEDLPSVPEFVKAAAEEVHNTPLKERGFRLRAMAVALKGLLPVNSRPITDAAIGMPWIHGINTDGDQDIALPLDSLTGHTLILGTTRAGKTRMFETLTTQIIHTGSALIVIDPKKDSDWVKRLRKECQRAGRKFLYFDAAKPSESIRINPLANFNSVSEVATRIGQLVDADGSFAAFAWKTLVRVQRGLVASGEKPNIKNTKYYVQMGVEGLAEKVIGKFMIENFGPEWDRDISNQPSGKGVLTRMEQMVALYTKKGQKDDTIDGLIAMIRHSKEHYSKMIQVLEPILEMLGSDEIGELLAPDPSNLNDNRPIWDIAKIIEEKAVLYVGLDSLSNKIIASAVGSVLLADLASTLGTIYNFSEPADAYLFVDELAEVANDQLLQVLNKGGGAGMKVFLASQAIADLAVRFGSKDKAEQMLANLNNLIALRVRSVETAKYISDIFGEIKTRSLETSFSTGSESSSSFTEFRSNVSKSLKREKSSLVSPTLLMRLPPLHFFAFISGRNFYKGAIEFIEG